MIRESTNTFILHARPFKETSLILNLFSQNQGRFSLLAKGVKRKNAQAQRAILQPFNLLNIEYAGRGELKVLCNAELVSMPSDFPARALACGYYLNELLIRALQEWQEFVGLFDVYSETIKALRDCSELAPLLRNFEVALLEELGVAPQWHIDIRGKDICSGATYRFISEQGFELIESKNTNSYTAANIEGYSGDAILCLGKGIYNPATDKMCQQITQVILRQIIGEKPLESRKLWI